MAERVYLDAELVKDAICECYITDDEKLMLIRRINRVPAADVVERPRWIPVTERLPEEKRASYLCRTDGGYCKEVRWTNILYGLVESENWGWCIFDIPQFSHVTHWMPLPPAPEPPKEEV